MSPLGLGWNEARKVWGTWVLGLELACQAPAFCNCLRPRALERSLSEFHSLWISASGDCGHSWVRPGSYSLELEGLGVLCPLTLSVVWSKLHCLGCYP